MNSGVHLQPGHPWNVRGLLALARRSRIHKHIAHGARSEGKPFRFRCQCGYARHTWFFVFHHTHLSSSYNGPVIAHIRGELISKGVGSPSAYAIVDCNGVGYEVALTALDYGALPTVGGNVALHIYTHVREDALALYGFLDPLRKQLFLRLISVTGVGPKAALDIMSGMTVQELVGALRGNDIARLVKIKGVGSKTAERLVLELRGKLNAFAIEPTQIPASASPLEEDVLSALVNLGYQRPAAEKALQKVKAGFEQLFRHTLDTLSR
jgi:Holliday junction DNA helicase RuvA